MILFSALCLALSVAILLRYWYQCHLDPPLNLRVAVDTVTRGVIPAELQSHIPVSYELREDHTMSATMERTFVRRGQPLWIIRLVLDDGHAVSDQAVLFDNNGDLYQ